MQKIIELESTNRERTERWRKKEQREQKSITCTSSASVSTIFCSKNSSFLCSFSSRRAIFKYSRAPLSPYFCKTALYSETYHITDHYYIYEEILKREI